MGLREKLCAGVPVLLDPAIAPASRLIKAAWIQEAVDARAAVIVDHAIICGPLDVGYRCIEREFRLTNCTFEDPVDFSRSSFKAVADYSGSTFGAEADFQSATFQFDLRLTGAVFASGAVRWSGTEIRQQLLAERVVFRSGASVHFDNCNFGDLTLFAHAEFGDSADFSGTHIGRTATFSGSRFCADAKFVGTTVDGDLNFGVLSDAGYAAASFESDVRFDSIQVRRRGNFRGVEFHGDASFLWAEIKGPTSFGADDNGLNGSHFQGSADFRDSVLSGDADFEGVVFRGEAKFSSAHCGGTLTFKTAQMHGPAEFDGISVGEELNFEGARFLPAAARADFEKASVKSSLFFSRAQFHNGASFEGMKVEGAVAQFNQVQFSMPTSFAATSFSGSCEFRDARFLPGSRPLFDGAHFDRSCSFDQAEFADGVRCRAVGFKGEATFQGTSFQATSDFSISHFEDIARFDSKLAEGGHAAVPAAQFRGTTCFEHVRFDSDARFDDVQFHDLVVFRETAFRVVYFSSTGRVGNQPQMGGAVDLTGCIYNRIRADWKSLLDAVHKYELLSYASYNRQPYAQLEKTYRAAGLDRDADDIYLTRRRVEGKRLKIRQQPFAWLLDRTYWALANYGVRPRRLLVCAALAVVLGVLIFRLPGSVTAKKDPSSPETCPVTSQNSLRTTDAIRLSVRYFLPVDITLVSPCAASTNYYYRVKFEDCAVLLHLLGWILVPVGIASLAGTLRRVAP